MGRGRAAKHVKKKKMKGQLIAIGVIAAVAVGIGYGIYNYTQNPPRTAAFGAVGSAHEHAAFKLFMNNVEPVDFTLPHYQVQSRYIHFEDDNGEVIHRHATGVDLGFFFETLGMKFDDQCITLGNGTSYCNERIKTLKFYVNDVKNDMYDKYVLESEDRILISYGSENQVQIAEQLKTMERFIVTEEEP
ncbi:MAG: protein-disulfide isomerase [Nitrososphaerales archaeon]